MITVSHVTILQISTGALRYLNIFSVWSWKPHFNIWSSIMNFLNIFTSKFFYHYRYIKNLIVIITFPYTVLMQYKSKFALLMWTEMILLTGLYPGPPSPPQTLTSGTVSILPPICVYHHTSVRFQVFQI